MDRHRRPPHALLPPHSRSARMVHRSVTPFSNPVPSTVPLPEHYLTSPPVCYSLGIYLLNLFLAFLQPKIDPSLTQDEGLEDGETASTGLPTQQDEEFRPFIRRLPEFKFWHSATRAIAISFACTWFGIFNVPVFWPVLVVYFLILFSLTSKSVRSYESEKNAILTMVTVRRQIQHMIKYRYVPFSFGKARYNQRSAH